MIVNTEGMFSVSRANRNFTEITRAVDDMGKIVLLKNNIPKYIMLDANSSSFLFDLTEEEIFEIKAKRILNKHISAFRELNK